jgi:glycosyltransferase involved in cell wall biosynthesis
VRIGLLTYGLDRPITGITRVILELGRALLRNDRCDVIFLTPYRRGPFVDPSGTIESSFLPGCSRLPGLMLLGGPELSVVARRYRLDIVHDPAGVSPFTLGRWAGSYARIVTLHDAIAFRSPEGYPLLHRILHSWYVPSTLPNVDGIITVSNHARSDLEGCLAIPQPPMHVVPNGVGDQFRPIPTELAEATAARYGLTRPYILTVGAVQPRKNFGRLLAAFAGVRRDLPMHRLAIVGAAPWGPQGLADLVQSHELAGRVVLAGYVEEKDLPAIYSAADLFVFPSLYEGFGLPPLEAMACGTPMIASNATSLPDVVGDGGMLVDARSTGSISEAILRLATDEALRASLRRRGLARASLFTWDEAARRTVEVYEAILGQASARPSARIQGQRDRD